MSINETNANQAVSMAHAAANLAATLDGLGGSSGATHSVVNLINRLSVVSIALLADKVAAATSDVNPAEYHTLEDDFQHFLSYRGLSSEPEDVVAKIRIGFAEYWKPSEKLQPAPAPIGDEVIVSIETTPGLTVEKLEDLSTLEAYFVRAAASGVIDFTVRCTHHQEGEGAHFYIHPANISGETLQFVVAENTLRNV